MKARVKATGKIVEVKYSRQMGPDAVYRDLVTGEHYMDFELSFLPEDGTPDYWTRLEHQAAIAAMQGLLTNTAMAKLIHDDKTSVKSKTWIFAEWAKMYAHALVEKYKEKEERK